MLRDVQVRADQGRLLHLLHQRRQGLLRNAASLLRLSGLLLRERLLLLHLVRQHVRLLRQERRVKQVGISPCSFRRPT